jgi:tRNA G46 methylase TrmB
MVEGNSRRVESSQSGQIHPQLDTIVKRHLEHTWKALTPEHTEMAFGRIYPLLRDRRIVLDSGCGNGKSTENIALLHPDCIVIGVDKSAHRLGCGSQISSNAYLVRADMFYFWGLIQDHDLEVRKHYLLYPNPWPKPSLFKRRIHAHPAFHALVKISREIELRTNWDVYAKEFAAACRLSGRPANVDFHNIGTSSILTPFELKYHRSGHELVRVVSTYQSKNTVNG